MSIINTDNLKNILSKFKEKIYTSINKNSDDILQLSNPNLLINGDFQVWQRGTSFELAEGEYKYTADQWMLSGDTKKSISLSDNGGAIINIKSDGTWSNFFQSLEPTEVKN